MPNMFGGDQFHPAYGRSELAPNEVMIGNTVYRIINATPFIDVYAEDIDGSTRKLTLSECPEKVQIRAAELTLDQI